MKIFKITFFVLALSIISCDKKSISRPEDIGKNVFELLKDIDKKTVADYNFQVITYDELKVLANNKKAKLGDSRGEMQAMTSSKFKSLSLMHLNKIQNGGKKFNIDWSKITYSSFVFDIFDSNIPDFGYVSKYVKGETYFKNTDGKIYLVKSLSFYDGKGYKTVLVTDVEPKDRS